MLQRISAAWIGLALLLGAGCGRHQESNKISIAAASDLQFALAEAARLFHEAHPEFETQVNFGSSGNFYAQIRNGAPFDLFLSADSEYPQNLIQQGLARADSFFVYGRGRLVVWVPIGMHLDPSTALRDPKVRRIAIANPEHAPYGKAAQAALQQMGLYPAIEAKLVLGENISQAMQFVQSGAADAGIVGLSQVLAPNLRSQGRYWEVPAESYPKMEQAGVILKESRAARAFREWLTGPEGRSLLERFGFVPQSN